MYCCVNTNSEGFPQAGVASITLPFKPSPHGVREVRVGLLGDEPLQHVAARARLVEGRDVTGVANDDVATGGVEWRREEDR